MFDWLCRCRNAIRQLNTKRGNRGRYPGKPGWTYAAFRDAFKALHEEGVRLGAHEEDAPELAQRLLRQCRSGMCVPSWDTVRLIAS